MLTESKLLEYESKRIDELIISEFSAQGHELTGNWSSSLFHEVTSNQDGASVCGYGLGYGMIVNYGVVPERIPFGGVGTGGGESAYIKGLIRFWKIRKPGLTEAKYISLAISTATVQKEQGMSTIASRNFSKTGQRQNFFEKLYKTLSDIDESIFLGLELILEEQTGDVKKIVY